LAFASLALAQTTQFLTETVVVIIPTGTVEVASSSALVYPSPTSAASGAAATHSIDVGLNGVLAYFPPQVSAAVGDTILFTFHAKNHTVTQSNFANACVTLEQSTGTSGFNSGFNPTNGTGVAPTFSFVVNDTKPIWWYCEQTKPESHCGQGMVGAVNAPVSGNTFSAFVQLAKNTANSSATPSGASASGGSSGSTGTGTGAGTPSSTGTGGSSGSGAFSTTANVGLTAILAVAGVALLAL